jgi:TonB family protein
MNPPVCKESTRRAFTWSALIHAAALGLLFLWPLLDWIFPPKPQAHVFEMVEIQHKQQENTAKPTKTPPPTHAFTLPKIPEITKPSIQPEHKLPSPKPVPAITPPQKDTPTAKPASQKITADQFFKNNPKKTTQTPVTTTQNRNPTPTIDAKRYSQELSNRLESAIDAPINNPANQSALTAYQIRVRELLNAAFERPTGLPQRQYEAIVQFSVSASGQIRSYDFIKSSGNNVFDQHVKNVFQRVTQVPSTPDGKPYTLQITFRLKDI